MHLIWNADICSFLFSFLLSQEWVSICLLILKIDITCMKTLPHPFPPFPARLNELCSTQYSSLGTRRSKRPCLSDAWMIRSGRSSWWIFYVSSFLYQLWIINIALLLRSLRNHAVSPAHGLCGRRDRRSELHHADITSSSARLNIRYHVGPDFTWKSYNFNKCLRS